MFSSAGSNRIQIDLLYCSFKPVRVCDCFSVYLPTHWKTRQDWRPWGAGDGCYLFQKISSSRIIRAGFYLNAYDRGIPRVRFETSFSLFAIVQFMFAQDIKSRWRSTKGIEKPIFISRITLHSTIFQNIAPKLAIKTVVLNNGDKRQNDLASFSLFSV